MNYKKKKKNKNSKSRVFYNLINNFIEKINYAAHV